MDEPDVRATHLRRENRCAAIANEAIRIADTSQRPIISTDQSARQALEDYFSAVLLPELRQQFPGEDDLTLSVCGLMGFLGPRDAMPPPALLVDELMELARAYGGASRVQLALAYGVGWERRARTGDSPWDSHWPGARQEVTDTVYNFTVQAWKVLVATVNGFKWADKKQLQGYALLMGKEFCDPPARTGLQFEREQRSVHCWDPSKGNLYGWIQQAVQGFRLKNEKDLRSYKFIGALLGRWLKLENTLCVGPVARRRCVECEAESGYDHRPCRNEACGAAYVPENVAVIRKRVLVIPPGAPESPHTFRPFWKCRRNVKEHGYFDYALARCPHCGEPRGQRPTYLLVPKAFGLG